MRELLSHDDLIAKAPKPVLALCAKLREHGKRGWIVGGCVRDLLRGVAVNDWDVATDARPDDVMRIFPRVIPTGVAHGTVTVLLHGTPYEVTTLRGEAAYSDGRRPDSVTFVDDISADLARRDFTVNAIALDPIDGHLIDPWDGRADLRAGVLRAVGDPVARFSEDGLRPLRAARFAATLESEIEPATLAAIGATISTYKKVSAERVRDEWMKAMKAKRPSRAFEVMRTTGLLEATVPEVMPSIGCAQNRFHAYDVWGHAMACLDACAGDAVLRVAAFFHDVGKPKTRAESEKTGDYTFYDHERVGAEMVVPILTRLRFSNEERARIAHLVRHHLVCYSDEWTDAAVRRWIRRVGRERLDDLYALNRADVLSKGKDASTDVEALEKLQRRVEGVLAAGDALSVRDLAVDGGALMKQLGLRPGRIVGELLEALLERVVDDPSTNDEARLLELAREHLAARGGVG